MGAEQVKQVTQVKPKSQRKITPLLCVCAGCDHGIGRRQAKIASIPGSHWLSSDIGKCSICRKYECTISTMGTVFDSVRADALWLRYIWLRFAPVSQYLSRDIAEIVFRAMYHTRQFVYMRGDGNGDNTQHCVIVRF